MTPRNQSDHFNDTVLGNVARTTVLLLATIGFGYAATKVENPALPAGTSLVTAALFCAGINTTRRSYANRAAHRRDHTA